MNLDGTPLGDTNDFAIEVMVEPDLKAPSAVWGRMCVHIGTTLGTIEDAFCALLPARDHFAWHVSRPGRLWDSLSDPLSPGEIHDTVRYALYGEGGRTAEEVHRDWEKFAAFDFLTNWGEQFDGFGSVIDAPDEHTIIILHRPQFNLESPPARDGGSCGGPLLTRGVHRHIACLRGLV